MEPNQAAEYGVRIVPAAAAPGQPYWKVRKVQHLSPENNKGRHNAFVTAYNGDLRVHDPKLRIGWTWDGRNESETVRYPALDKPSTEPAGDVPIERGMNMSLWLTGDGLLSERVENMHTNHPDERTAQGTLWNSIGHHSFAIEYERAVMGDVDEPVAPVTPPEPPVPGLREIQYHGAVTITLPSGVQQTGVVIGTFTPL